MLCFSCSEEGSVVNMPACICERTYFWIYSGFLCTTAAQSKGIFYSCVMDVLVMELLVTEEAKMVGLQGWFLFRHIPRRALNSSWCNNSGPLADHISWLARLGRSLVLGHSHWICHLYSKVRWMSGSSNEPQGRPAFSPIIG